jgi:16S rRNA (cytosine1402-N4)-methyltransferase
VNQFHTPVLLNETIDLLAVKPGKTYLDATLGNGGHTQKLLDRQAIVFGLDYDPNNLEIATQRLSNHPHFSNFHPILGNFKNLSRIYKKSIHQPLDGILFDLGLSSNQLLSANRGFSFNDSHSLDMRLNRRQTLTAEYVINTYSFDELYQIFTKYAQEKYAKPLILRIIKQRQSHPITQAARLADIIRDYYQQHHLNTSIDPATKIFMALRIFVNDELENLKKTLHQTLSVLQSHAIVCVISFHSGEDRIVKSFIRTNSQQVLNLTPKPVLPSLPEIQQNPLSRSAVLRSYRIK